MFRSSLAPRIGRALSKQPSTFSFASRRSLQSVPPLDQRFSQDGVPGFLSAHAFSIAWTQYQDMMVQGLNRLLVAPGDASLKPIDILQKYARDPNQAPTFNYASMAHNNHFFFKTLSTSKVPRPIPSYLKSKLEKSFSSMDTLQREFVYTACAMFGPGFVWLVQDSLGNYKLLCTYLAGSPYPKAHYRNQVVDRNTEDKPAPEAIRRANSLVLANGAGAHGPLSGTNIQRAPGGAKTSPVLCLNTWEHVYLPDYGVAQKRQYVENWWKVIDWDVVAQQAGVHNQADPAKKYQS